jgi:UDP-2,3-diacylglucosamine pyrophosphatase LpxH
MEAVKTEEGEKYGEVKGPFIVVSDVHLGGKRSNYEDFRDFLEWLKNTLSAKGISLECNGYEIKIRKPGTILLLGDILELWDPRKDDRDYVIKDVLTPISILNDIDCDIIYVIGNHDEDLYDIKKLWGKEGIKFPYKGKGTFKIFYRTYPERIKGTNRVEGIKIGKNKYAFLHGHQFDKLQICHRISRFLSKLLIRVNDKVKLKDKVEEVRFDPIDWHQDLANVSFTKNIRKKLNWPTTIFSLLLILYILFTYIFWFKLGGNWASNQKVLTITIGKGVILGFIFWVLFSSFFVVTILPKVVTWSATKIWERVLRIKKCTSVEDVIKKPYRYKKGKHIKADIVVFGHTHNAGKCYMEKENKLFINTGCWVSECEERKRNTFLYIDNGAPFLLIWDKEKIDKGEITCLEDFRKVLS